MKRSIEAGVKVIEHGQMITEETAKLMAEKDVWLSIQIAFLGEEPTAEQVALFGEVTAAKFRRVREGVATRDRLREEVRREDRLRNRPFRAAPS